MTLLCRFTVRLQLVQKISLVSYGVITLITRVSTNISIGLTTPQTGRVGNRVEVLSPR